MVELHQKTICSEKALGSDVWRTQQFCWGMPNDLLLKPNRFLSKDKEFYRHSIEGGNTVIPDYNSMWVFFLSRS